MTSAVLFEFGFLLPLSMPLARSSTLGRPEEFRWASSRSSAQKFTALCPQEFHLGIQKQSAAAEMGFPPLGACTALRRLRVEAIAGTLCRELPPDVASLTQLVRAGVVFFLSPGGGGWHRVLIMSQMVPRRAYSCQALYQP